jgi:hypothetical protein
MHGALLFPGSIELISFRVDHGYYLFFFENQDGLIPYIIEPEGNSKEIQRNTE